MRFSIFFTIFFTSALISQELQIKADSFNGDEKLGISTFEGNVNVIKERDELNASKVVVNTDEKHQPTKFTATGSTSFTIYTKEGSLYKGKAEKVIYFPDNKEYHFFQNVHLKQIDEKKEIIGDEVILKSVEGKAYAKGLKEEPVIMIFKLPEDTK